MNLDPEKDSVPEELIIIANIPYFNAWKEFSVQQMLETARNRRNLDLSPLIDLLRLSRSNDDFDELLSSPLTGKLSEGWIDFDSKVCPKFQDAYAWVSAIYREHSNPSTPLEYLIQFYREGVKLGLKTHQEFDLGRALRNWPSLKREDLLFDLMLAYGLRVHPSTVGENVHKHADFYYYHERGKVVVWSYLSTAKGIGNLVKKLLERGVLEKGLNLLAPLELSTDMENYEDWYVPSMDYVQRLVKACDGNPVPFERLKEEIEYSNDCLKKFVLFE